MKRCLVCKKCVGAWIALIGKYPGEEVKIVKGTSKAAFVCDDCGSSIERQHFAAAVTVSREPEPRGITWEGDYIKPFPSDFQSARAPLPAKDASHDPV